VPGDIVSSMGDPAAWAGDLISLASLAMSIRAGRRDRAADFSRSLEKDTGYTGEQIGEILQRVDELAELVATALDAAARSVDQRKRRVLARAAAIGILGDESVRVDDRILFVRTLEELDVVHMQLLNLISQDPGDYPNAGRHWTHEAIGKAWPGVAESVDPLVATLSSSGLIVDSLLGTLDYPGPGWRPTPYGARFAAFVAAADPTIGPGG